MSCSRAILDIQVVFSGGPESSMIPGTELLIDYTALSQLDRWFEAMRNLIRWTLGG